MTDLLAEAVATFKYKPGWQMRLVSPGPDIYWPVDGTERYLEITFAANDSATGQPLPFPIRHEFPVPELGLTVDWDRWLFSRILDAEPHEAMEFFQVNGIRPFYPEHGGTQARMREDLYAIRRRRPA